MSLGFYVDLASCIGCKTCQVACKDRRDIQVAGPRLRRVDTFECGTDPEVAMFHLNLSCHHCESPACVANCPTGAMYKDDDGLHRLPDLRELVPLRRAAVHRGGQDRPEVRHLPGAARGGP